MVTASLGNLRNGGFTTSPHSPAIVRRGRLEARRVIATRQDPARDAGDLCPSPFPIGPLRRIFALGRSGIAVNAGPFRARERDRFVDDLLGYMTLEEKLGQLDLDHPATDPGLEAAIVAGKIGGVRGCVGGPRLQALAIERSRLGIPLLLIDEDVPSVVSPWALAAAWDEDLASAIGAEAARLALSRGANAMIAPRVNLGDDPQQAARSHIATSEPHLAARLAVAFGAGAGANAKLDGTGALAIARCGDGSVTRQRELAIELAQAGDAVAIDCEALDGDLAQRAGFSGLLMSECRRLQTQLAERFTTTRARSVIEAAERALDEGVIDIVDIDMAVRGTLAAKHRLGLFREPERTMATLASNENTVAAAGRLRKTMVLLRNESGLLPLSPVSDRVLVVGDAGGAAGACIDALGRSGIGYSLAPGLALRRAGEFWSEPVPGDHFALSLTRDAARRADFVLVVLEDRHFVRGRPGQWQQPSPAVLAMLRALSPVGSRLVAIIATAEPVDLGSADQHFAAVLQGWQPAEGFAEALGDVLSGRHAPQGRMPVNVGRFAFGQGLGFGESVFSSYRVSPAGDHVLASVRVRNAGSFASRETVQLYIRAESGGWQLAGFEHVTLAPGEDVPVEFQLGAQALGEIGPHGRREVRAGSHQIAIGKNSDRLLAAEVAISPALARAIASRDQGYLRLAAG